MHAFGGQRHDTLIEAIRKFRLDLSGGNAVDLGASPGGWTYVLAGLGYEVTAIDPGALDPRVLQLASVRHVRGRAEAYVADRQFDVLVNDMGIDPDLSAAQTLRMAPHLRPGAHAIMTFKCVSHPPERDILKAKEILARAFEVSRIVSLFHNRCEVTALLVRK